MQSEEIAKVHPKSLWVYLAEQGAESSHVIPMGHRKNW